MEEWKEYKIGDICRIKHGFAFKGIHFVDEPQRYVCVTPGNFALKGGFKNDKPKYYNGPIPEDYVLQKDDLVVTMTDLSKNGDTLGYSALIPYDEHYIFLHNQRIGLIEDISTDIDKHFLYWVMRTYDYQRYIVGHCSGSTVKHTSPSGIGSYVFRCPDLKMQKEISSVLDNLDDKIEVNRRINDNLEQQAQALFKSWFVDFEPFKDGEFVESELGMIPKGWRVTELEEVCTIKYGKGLGKNDLIQDGFPVFGGNGIIGFYSLYLYDLPQILVSCRGAASGKIIESLPQSYVTSNSLVLELKDRFYYNYIKFLLLSNPLYDYATGSAQPQITIDNIKGVKIILPLQEVINQLNPKLETIGITQRNNNNESRRLAQLRDTLLPRLMSGELDVNNVAL